MGEGKGEMTGHGVLHRFAGSTWVVGGSKAAEADDYDDDYDEDEPASQAAVASKQEDAAGKGAGEAAPPEQQHRADGDEAPAPKLEDAGEGKGEDLVINNVTLGKINGTAVLSYTELFPTMVLSLSFEHALPRSHPHPPCPAACRSSGRFRSLRSRQSAANRWQQSGKSGSRG